MSNDFFELLNSILYNEQFAFGLECPLGSLPFGFCLLPSGALWAVCLFVFAFCLLFYAMGYSPSGNSKGGASKAKRMTRIPTKVRTSLFLLKCKDKRYDLRNPLGCAFNGSAGGA